MKKKPIRKIDILLFYIVVVVQENDLLVVPVIGLHNDPAYYPNPKQFNPENFSKAGSAADLRHPFLGKCEPRSDGFQTTISEKNMRKSQKDDFSNY